MLKRIYAFLLAAVWALALAGCALGTVGAIGKYNIIYADPPWKYGTWHSADRHYPTIPIEDIKALPVSELAAEDCALFLWITMPMLHEAWGVMEAWGFRFVTTAFVWVKLSRKSNTVFWAWYFILFSGLFHQ